MWWWPDVSYHLPLPCFNRVFCRLPGRESVGRKFEPCWAHQACQGLSLSGWVPFLGEHTISDRVLPKAGKIHWPERLEHVAQIAAPFLYGPSKLTLGLPVFSMKRPGFALVCDLPILHLR